MLFRGPKRRQCARARARASVDKVKNTFPPRTRQLARVLPLPPPLPHEQTKRERDARQHARPLDSCRDGDGGADLCFTRRAMCAASACDCADKWTRVHLVAVTTQRACSSSGNFCTPHRFVLPAT